MWGVTCLLTRYNRFCWKMVLVGWGILVPFWESRWFAYVTLVSSIYFALVPHVPQHLWGDLALWVCLKLMVLFINFLLSMWSQKCIRRIQGRRRISFFLPNIHRWCTHNWVWEPRAGPVQAEWPTVLLTSQSLGSPTGILAYVKSDMVMLPLRLFELVVRVKCVCRLNSLHDFIIFMLDFSVFTLFHNTPIWFKWPEISFFYWVRVQPSKIPIYIGNLFELQLIIMVNPFFIDFFLLLLLLPVDLELWFLGSSVINGWFGLPQGKFVFV